MTVADIEARMPSSEMTEWRAYYTIEANERAEAERRAQARNQRQRRGR